MNMDLLKKLTRLANHNPNDNEANLAARRVCKMLEECNWGLSSPKTAQSKVYSRPAQTWEDVARSEEPQWSSARPSGPGYSIFDDENIQRMKDLYETLFGRKNPLYTEDWAPKNQNPRPKNEYQCRDCSVRFMADSVYPTIECVQCKGEARRIVKT